MPWNPSLTSLRDVLAALFPTVQDSNRVVDAAGLPRSHIQFDSAAISNWHNILDEAMKRGMVSDIIDAAQAEYPENQDLRQVSAECRVRSLSTQVEDLRTACSNTTRTIASQLLGRTPAIRRASINSLIEECIASDRRWCVLEGPSGVGKSVVVAQTALRLEEEGWIPLLVRGRAFSVEEAARDLARQMPLQYQNLDWYQLLISPWKEQGGGSARGLVILIDGLDERPAHEMEQELSRLSAALDHIPLTLFKVVVSSGEISWESMKWNLSTGDGRSLGETDPIAVGDFDDEELRLALTAIGATDLIHTELADGRIDPHVMEVLELLQHPATFAIFAELRNDERDSRIDEVTWPALVDRFVDRGLRYAASRANVPVGSLRQYMVAFADLAHRNNSPDFRLEVDFLRSELVKFEVDSTDKSSSGFTALLQRGFLEELEGPSGRRLIGFRNRNVGAYFLSYALERAAESLPPDALPTFVTNWLEQVFDYPPVVDALVAWVYRLSREPDDSRLTAIVDSILSNRSLELEVVFRILPSSVADQILVALERAASEHTDSFREASLAVRPSGAALGAFRRRLGSKDVRVLKLAIRAVGFNRDVESIPTLLHLLEHPDDDVQQLATRALGRIGVPVVPSLLSVIGNTTEPSERRDKFLQVIEAVGYRSKEVDQLLGVLAEKSESMPVVLSRRLLLTAAKLRSPAMTSSAIQALGATDWRLILAAAKLLTEVPVPEAVDALTKALATCAEMPADELDKYSLVRQLVLALMESSTIEAKNVVTSLLQSCFVSQIPLSSIEATWIIEDLSLPQAKVLVLNDLSLSLQLAAFPPQLWYSLQVLSEDWQSSELDKLDETVRERTSCDSRIGSLMVAAILDAYEGPVSSFFRNFRAQEAAIKTLVKCRIPDLAIELCRLLPKADWPLYDHICNALRVLGDTRAEAALLAAIEAPPINESETRSRETALLSALAMCGSERSATWLLNHLRTHSISRIQQDLFIYVLNHLMLRGKLHPDRVSELVANSEVSDEARLASLFALASYDGGRYAPLFRNLAQHLEDGPLRAYAAGALGIGGNEADATLLMLLLQATNDPLTIERSSMALSALCFRPAIPFIEQATRETDDQFQRSRIAVSLAQFKDPMTVPTLLTVLARTTHPYEREQLIKALASFWPDDLVKQAVFDELEQGSGGWSDRGVQNPSITVLARSDPELLLKLAVEWLDSGFLDPSARQLLAHWMPQLAMTEELDEELLSSVLQKLIANRDFWVREKACQAMVLLPPGICRQACERLIAQKEAWTTACAVRTLGFWCEDLGEVEAWRRCADLNVRDAADAAKRAFFKRMNLDLLIEDLGSGDPGKRASAYYSLKDHGDEAALWTLEERFQDEPLKSHVDSINDYVYRRRRNQLQKEARERRRDSQNLRPDNFD